MAIEIKVPRAVQIRRLHEIGLEPADISKLTGYQPKVVREALSAGKKGVPVSK